MKLKRRSGHCRPTDGGVNRHRGSSADLVKVDSGQNGPAHFIAI
jgi:hypothetical protein